MFARDALSWRAWTLPVRVAISGSILVVVTLCIVFGILSRWAQRSGDAVVERELGQSADLVAHALAARQRGLTGGARVFVQGPYFRSFVAERRREEVLDQTLEAWEQLDADWVFVVDERGVLLAKSDETSAFGVDLSGVPLVAGALQGRVTSGFGVSRDSVLFQAVGVPIVVPGSAPIGALVATKVVDSLLARELKAATSADVVFFVRGPSGSRIAASTLGSQLPGGIAPVTDKSRSSATIGGVRYATQGATATTAGGDIVGGYVVLSARDATSAEIAEVRRALLIAGLVGLALVWAGALVAARRVATPMRALAEAARRATDGDYELPRRGAGVLSATSRAPEIGALDEALSHLVAELRDRQALVTAMNASAPALASMSATAAVAASAVTPALSMHRVQGVGARGASGSAGRALGREPNAPTGDPAAGDLIADRYRVESVIGTGSMGVTYRVRDRIAGSDVALKRLRTESGDESARTIELLREQLKQVRRISHRNVIRVHDAGSDAGVPFLTMDHVQGVALAQLLRANGPLGEDAVLSLAKQLCRALSAAHACEVVHGGLAPKQLFLGHDGLLKVGDFALARLERRLRDRASARADLARQSAIPQLAGATVGAPEYMAPEQLLGEEPTARSDIYAAGVVLYECVTGSTPFRTDSPLAFLAQKLSGGEGVLETDAAQGPVRSRSRIATVLSEAISVMIATDPERRPLSAGALLADLERAE